MMSLGGDVLKRALERAASASRRRGGAGAFSPDDYAACATRWDLTPEQSDLRPSSITQLLGQLLQWEMWARLHGHLPCPADPGAVIQFLDARERETSRSTAGLARRALHRGHRCLGLPDPTQDPAVCEYWRRRDARTTELKRLQSTDAPASTSDSPADSINGSALSPVLRAELQRNARTVQERRFELQLNLSEVDELARHFRLNSLAPNSREAYAYRLWAYLLFCEHHGLEAFPASPQTVARFLAAYGATRSPSTLALARAALHYVHRQDDQPDPTDTHAVREVLEGHARKWRKPKAKKLSLTTNSVKAIADRMSQEGSILALRDKAILLLSYTGAFRRSEATSTRDHASDNPDEFDTLHIDDITASREGLEILIQRSKTDQKRAGQTVYVTYASDPRHCAVLAVLRWKEYLAQQGIVTGPLFVQMKAGRSGCHGIRPGQALGARGWIHNLKGWAQLVGLDPRTIGGHSLRRGHVTEASRGGAPILSLVRQGRWRSLETILTYHDEALGHRTSTSKYLGL